MHRAFYFPIATERSRYKERLEASLAGLCELEMLKQRHECLVRSALTLGDTVSGRAAWGVLRPPHAFADSPNRTQYISGLGGQQGLMADLQQQVGELRVDTESSCVKHPNDAGYSGPNSGFHEQSERQSPLDSGELSPRTMFPMQLPSTSERPKTAGDVLVTSLDGLQDGGGRCLVPRSLSSPQTPLTGATEKVVEGEVWLWPAGYEAGEDGPPAVDAHGQVQRVETYIMGLIQRRLLTSRQCKPRPSLGPEARGVARQSSLCRKAPPFAAEHSGASPGTERPVWASYSLEEERLGGMSPEEQLAMRYPRPTLAGVYSTSPDFPCGPPQHSSSEADSPQQYSLLRSPSSDEQLVNAQYIPAQPCRAPARARMNRTPAAPKAGRPAYSPERVAAKPRATPKKCRFTEERAAAKKPGRKACRSQSENSLLSQRGVPERKYSTVERDTGRVGQPRGRRAQGSLGHRRWRSTLELSQDEAEPPPEQAIRRSRRSRPAPSPYVYNQVPHHLHHPHQLHQPHLHSECMPHTSPCRQDGGYKHVVSGDWESSLSEGESPGSSSMTSDSDESGGLVWPQQLAPQLAPPGAPLQSKALVKIKASHALKKKILRFRTGSLKVMTTV
ncbi:dapper 1 isoform X1 [Electrophorus electricus]|uniref:Dishevelled-binding antagonist of beta-catenin 3a n=2 Tax=Electrophorus electricus TaxID=8005 RepID=A0A4W4GK31_ELEEL|nr:dapper 1 isoform X1 [Electrophorus electricus]